MKNYSNYFYNFFKLNNDDMATADMDRLYAGILVKKRLFFPKPRKRFKIKPIVKNGRIKNIEITAPYWFVVQLFKRLNYKPFIDEENCLTNHFGSPIGYIYREEWENLCLSDASIKNKGEKKCANK